MSGYSSAHRHWERFWLLGPERDAELGLRRAWQRRPVYMTWNVRARVVMPDLTAHIIRISSPKLKKPLTFVTGLLGAERRPVLACRKLDHQNARHSSCLSPPGSRPAVVARRRARGNGTVRRWKSRARWRLLLWPDRNRIETARLRQHASVRSDGAARCVAAPPFEADDRDESSLWPFWVRVPRRLPQPAVPLSVLEAREWDDDVRFRPVFWFERDFLYGRHVTSDSECELTWIQVSHAFILKNIYCTQYLYTLGTLSFD